MNISPGYLIKLLLAQLKISGHSAPGKINRLRCVAVRLPPQTLFEPQPDWCTATLITLLLASFVLNRVVEPAITFLQLGVIENRTYK